MVVPWTMNPHPSIRRTGVYPRQHRNRGTSTASTCFQSNGEECIHTICVGQDDDVLYGVGMVEVGRRCISQCLDGQGLAKNNFFLPLRKKCHHPTISFTGFPTFNERLSSSGRPTRRTVTRSHATLSFVRLHPPLLSANHRLNRTSSCQGPFNRLGQDTPRGWINVSVPTRMWRDHRASASPSHCVARAT